MNAHPDGASGAPKKVLLVEDHASFRQALATILNREPDLEVSGQAGSAAEARDEAAGADVALVDLGLPGGGAIKLIEDLSSDKFGVSVLVLSAILNPLSSAEAVEAGAAGFLSKSASIGEILNSVRRVGRGERLYSVAEAVQMFRMAAWNRQRSQQAASTDLLRLTQREVQVLQALSEGLDDREIAERLQIAVDTERIHITNILRKLNLRTRLQAAIFAIRHDVALL